MGKLTAKKQGEAYVGVIMAPHKYSDDCYVATTSKFEIDQVRVDTLEELETLYLEGFGVRMSNREVDPRASYICHDNLKYSEDVSESPVITVSKHLEKLSKTKDLDNLSVTTSRKEQIFLRLHLTKGEKIAACILCGKEFPVDFLVAAHIKRRANCNQAERLDFDNVAALMCKSGCDDLFEKGYIFVSAGTVQENSKKESTPALKTIIAKLKGNEVNNWLCSQKYYEWHKKKYTK